MKTSRVYHPAGPTVNRAGA